VGGKNQKRSVRGRTIPKYQLVFSAIFISLFYLNLQLVLSLVFLMTLLVYFISISFLKMIHSNFQAPGIVKTQNLLLLPRSGESDNVFTKDAYSLNV